MKVYPENKKHDLCVTSIENQFLVSFSLDPALYYATPRHNPRSDVFKNGLKLSARLEEKKVMKFQREKKNRLRYNKKCRGGADSGSFRVKFEPILAQIGEIFEKIDPFMYQILRFLRGHSYTKTLILLPMLAAHPRRVFCTDYPPGGFTIEKH